MIDNRKATKLNSKSMQALVARHHSPMSLFQSICLKPTSVALDIVPDPDGRVTALVDRVTWKFSSFTFGLLLKYHFN